ncbi:hypothetical protein [Halobaculum marinum]|uniref:Uncharacterized protein n=1 Tax=Halobaculum marinum TaxID=3031996 RepID=A0ABD5WQY4_9EURY|nr:hypothetical protein [Halobaculum sp. DT55]
MPGRSDPTRPVEAVQNAAVEHALTAGESRRALALAGALDPLRAAAGDDPALTALSTTLTAWLGLRERDPNFGAVPPSPPTPDPAAEQIASGEEGSPHPPAVVGAAVACERFDVSPPRAAALAGCSRAAVDRALADRERTTPDR